LTQPGSIRICGANEPLAPQAVTLRLTDGRALTWRCSTMRACPSRPLDRAAHLDKFRLCWHFAGEMLPADNAERLIDLADRLERLADVRDLTRLLAA
jgi:hypothetical protein